ncbi:MAG: hypothetical protein U0984_13565, partial [Prosthecobacter sp.]|nr:hypothetical protein [Prosthecobacter sp.]
MSAKNLGAASVIETLEPRLAPAGTVILTTVGGVLTITGDVDNNGLRVLDVPGTGKWSINDALSGTSFILNGVPQAVLPFLIPAQNAIKATLGAGNDQIEIFGSGTPSGMILSGALTVSGGTGNDTFFLGSSSSQSLQILGAAAIDMGDGNDLVQTNASVLFGGTTTFKTGAGNDSVTFLTGGQHVFQKGVKIDLGVGSDAIAVASSRFDVFGGTLSIVGAGLAAAAQTISIYPDFGTSQGAATVSILAGNVALKVGTTSLSEFRFGAGLAIATGPGADSVVFNGLVQATGAVLVDMKDGNDSFSLASSAKVFAASLAAKMGGGDDGVILGANSILATIGAFTTDLGTGGLSHFTVSSGHTLTAGSLSIMGGPGEDTIDFAGSMRVFGAAIVDLKDQTNALTTAAGTSLNVGSLTFKGGTGSDAVVFSDNSIVQCAGLFSLVLGAGTNDFEMVAGSFLSAGSLNSTGGVGNDDFTFNGAAFSVLGAMNMNLGTGVNRVDIASTGYNFIGGALKLTGTAGNDSFYFSSPDSRVLGPVSLNFGDGTNAFDIQGAKTDFGSSFGYTGGAGLEDCYFGIGKLQIAGAVTIKVGSGTNAV